MHLITRMAKLVIRRGMVVTMMQMRTVMMIKTKIGLDVKKETSRTNINTVNFIIIIVIPSDRRILMSKLIIQFFS